MVSWKSFTFVMTQKIDIQSQGLQILPQFSSLRVFPSEDTIITNGTISFQYPTFVTLQNKAHCALTFSSPLSVQIKLAQFGRFSSGRAYTATKLQLERK